jgi:anti-sigma regulatory factor (Ser/Thr protein kinase)
VLWEWKLGYLADDGELLASELLSNAVNAATASPGAGVVALRLLAYEQRLRVEVWDHSPGHPVSRTLDGTTEGGRGCTVIAAIAGTWGCQRIHPKLKVVWAELLIPGECR